MNNNLHDTDDFFNAAYRQFEEEPSAGVWEKINENLHKKEADSKRKNFLWWGKIAVVSLLLFAGIILFDAGVIKKEAPQSTGNTNTKTSITPELRAKPHEIPNDEVNTVGKEIKVKDKNDLAGNSAVENNFIIKKHENTLPLTYPLINGNGPGIGKRPVDKNWRVSENLTDPNEETKMLKNTNAFLKEIEILQPENIPVIPLIEKNYPGKLHAGFFTGQKPVYINGIGHAVLKNRNAKIKKAEKNNSFFPYWLVTAFVSCDRVNYKLDSDLPANISSIQHGEEHEPSFSGGILATRQLSPHLGLQTGLLFANTAIGISPQKLYALPDPAGDIAFKYITSSGYAFIKPGLGIRPAIGDSLNTIDGKHVQQLLRIPVMVKYSVGKKLIITPGAGIEANFLTSAKVEIEIEHPFKPEIVFIDKLDGAKPFHVSVIADVELRYPVNKKLWLNLRPAFRYAISPITKNNVVETFPYNFGIGIGMTCKF